VTGKKKNREFGNGCRREKLRSFRNGNNFTFANDFSGDVTVTGQVTDEDNYYSLQRNEKIAFRKK